ncbi:hypothetical protein P4114_25025 [Pseudomonas aeruginosa]|nr:hypothetical protein [Pseudomonas aeruginosa]
MASASTGKHASYPVIAARRWPTTLQLLNQAQLLCGSVQHSWTGQEHWVVHHLTLAGHDLLDRLRQESAAAAVPVRKSA